MIERLVDGRDALSSLWSGYIVLVHATTFAAGVALFLPFVRSGHARAALHANLLVGMLIVSLLCWLPIGWWASVLPETISEPLYLLGASRVSAAGASESTAVRVAAWVYALWIAGCAITLFRLAAGWAAMAWVAQRATERGDASWRVLLREASAVMQTGQVVTLRFSQHISTPVTWGWLDPEILLPLDAREWPLDLRRMVLLHELAHVRRADAAMQLLASLTRALYWFHPLVVFSARRLRLAREEAADAMVIAQGVKRSAYADCLMHVAEGGGMRAGSCVAIAMASRSTLELRLHRVLAGTGAPPANRTAMTFVAAAIVWVAVMGSVRLAPQRSITVERLSSPDWAMRGYAAHLLGRTRIPAIRDRLRDVSLNDPNAMVRSIARSAR